MLEKTAGQIIEAVTAKLDSPQGQRKLQQLADHHERIARSRSILKQQLRRLGKRPGVAFYGSVGSLTERKVEVDVRLLGRSCGSIQLVPGREGQIGRAHV